MAIPRHLKSNGSNPQGIVSDSIGDDSSEDEDETARPPVEEPTPMLVHRFKHNSSILAVAIANNCIYAATQSGEILVFDLDTCERIAVIQGHDGSVLGLCLSQDKRLLFSSAADRLVNVWDASTFRHMASIYSFYDIGDVFCISYSPRLETVYLGAQNTSIQWCDLKNLDSRPQSHPLFREDRFFDSPGPGGSRSSRRASPGPERPSGRSDRYLEINKEHIHQFAHYGFVYCMILAEGSSLGSQLDEILISGGGDGAIKLWSLDRHHNGKIREIGILEDGRSEGDSILTIILDGTILYAGRIDGEINCWDLETRQLVRTLKSYDGDILTLSIGHGLLFSADTTGLVKKFNQRHELINSWRAHTGRVLASHFTQFRDRFIYVTGGNDDTVAVWDIGDCIGRPSTPSKTSHEQLFDSLRQFISYRTVSADAHCKGDCRRGASYLRFVLQSFGASTELLKTEDGYNPVVFARFHGNPATSAKRKKILFYGHYDVVQAENMKGNWTTDPFTMHGVDGYLYGRGVSDNKGPIMAAIYAVAELVARKELDSDIVFLIEGEEECGSRGFKRAVRAHKDLIGKIDWILLANSYWLDDEAPCLTYGLRGLIHATVEVHSDEPDLHSGVDGSRLLDESLKDLVMLLARLSGPHGRVNIPNFYSSILPVTKDEQRLYREISETLLERNPDLGTPSSLIASLMHRWGDATLTIHNFKTSGPSNLTIIPQLAQAALSIRLVPNQDVDEIGDALISFLKTEFAALGSTNQLNVTINHKAEPWHGDYRNEIFQTLEHAVMEAWRPLGRLARAATSPQPQRKQSGPMRRRSTLSSKPQPATSSTLAGTNLASPTSPSDHFPFSPLPNTADLGVAAGLGPSTSNIAPAAAGSSTTPQRPLYIREGGSIPAIRFLEKEFGAPAAHLPCGQASDNAHLDNERFRVLNLWKAVEVFGRVFRELPRK